MKIILSILIISHHLTFPHSSSERREKKIEGFAMRFIHVFIIIALVRFADDMFALEFVNSQSTSKFIAVKKLNDNDEERAGQKFLRNLPRDDFAGCVAWSEDFI